MNNTALGNTSVLPLSDNSVDFYALMIHSFSLLARLPVNIFIIQLILSRRWITSEVYAFKEAIFAIMICLYDVIRIASTFFPNKYLLNTRLFFDVMVVIGHSSLLTVTCVAQYLAVLKPLFFLKLKSLKYRLASVCTTCLWTLMFCCGSLLLDVAFRLAAVGQIVVCSVTQLYCCVVILWALKQPRPGETGGQNDRTSAVKLRAAKIILFNTVRILFVYVPFAVVSCYDFFTMQQSQIVLKLCYFMGTLTESARALMFLQKSGQIAFIKWL